MSEDTKNGLKAMAIFLGIIASMIFFILWVNWQESREPQVTPTCTCQCKEEEK